MKITDPLNSTHNCLYLQLFKDVKDLQIKQKEHHGVFESLRECIAHLTSTAGRFLMSAKVFFTKTNDY